MREITKLNLMRTLRATGAFSFIPEGRTYSPLVTRAVVSFPKVRLVRSPRGMRHLRMPMEDTASRHPPRRRKGTSILEAPLNEQNTPSILPSARINLPPAALFAVMASQTAPPSSFAKRSKTGTRGR
jgi:hypothetical protein